MSSARPADDDGGRAPPSRDAFAGLESLGPTPDDDVGVNRDDDGMDGMILGLSAASDGDNTWGLDAFDQSFGESPPTGGGLQFPFMDATTNAAASSAVDDRVVNMHMQMMDPVTGALGQPPPGNQSDLGQLPDGDVQADFGTHQAPSPPVEPTESNPPAPVADAAQLEQQRVLASTPARPADMPTPSALQQQQLRMLQMKQQQEQQVEQRQEQQKQQLEQRQYQLAQQLDASSRLATGPGPPKQSAKTPTYSPVSRGRNVSSDPSISLRQHEQACRRSRRPPTHGNQRPLSGAISRSPTQGAHGGGGSRNSGVGQGSPSNSHGNRTATIPGTSSGAESIGTGGSGNSTGVFSPMGSTSMPTLSVGVPGAGAAANGRSLGGTSRTGGSDRGSRGVSSGGAGTEQGSASRRDSELVNTIQRLERKISELDVSSRTCLRDALLSLSNKAANPNMQPSPEQEQLNRAAEYLVLRMLFLSGQHVPHTAPGTGGPMPGSSLGSFPAPGQTLPEPVAHLGSGQIMGALPPADQSKMQVSGEKLNGDHGMQSSGESHAGFGIPTASSAEFAPRAPSGLAPATSAKLRKDDTGMPAMPKLEPTEDTPRHP